MPTCLIARPAVSLVALVVAGFGATGARAGLETITLPRHQDANCSHAHESNPSALWRSSQGQFIVSGQGSARIEVYGHGIDLSPGAELTGIRVSGVSASAKLVGSRSGFVNGPKGCGFVGSVLVDITFPAVSSANSGTLTIGGETILVKARPKVVQFANWTTDNRAGGLPGVGSPGTGTVSAPPGSSPPPVVMTVGGGTSCPGATNAQGCVSGPGTSLQMQGGFGGHSDTREPNRNTLSRCASDLGLKGTLGNDNSLTLTLPAQRTGQMKTCFTRHLLVGFVLRGIEDHLTLDGQEPAVAVAASHGLPVTISLDTTARNSSGIKYGAVKIDPAFLENFVGRQTFDLNISPTSTTSSLKLILVSEPAYGPKTISVGSWNTALGRQSSNITPRVTTHQPALPGQTFYWWVQSSDVPVATCFEAIEGTVTAPVGGTQVELPLKAKEVAACYGKTFTVGAATGSAGATALGAAPLFRQTANFVLPALNRPLTSLPTNPAQGSLPATTTPVVRP